TAAIKAIIKGIVAKSPSGNVILPGRITARNNVIGTSNKEAANTAGCPTAKALSIPINNSLPGNLFLTKAVAASEIGVKPSINKETIRGNNNITATVATPQFNTPLTSY